jgi:hypothetical protein
VLITGPHRNFIWPSRQSWAWGFIPPAPTSDHVATLDSESPWGKVASINEAKAPIIDKVGCQVGRRGHSGHPSETQAQDEADPGDIA